MAVWCNVAIKSDSGLVVIPSDNQKFINSSDKLTLKRRERIGKGLMDPELDIATPRSRVRQTYSLMRFGVGVRKVRIEY